MKNLVLGFSILFSVISSKAQTNSEKDFIGKNKAVITASAVDNPLFDKAFFDNRLFLFGENHGSSIPQSIDLGLFKLLYKKAGVRFYVAEVDATKAWMLNQYLKDGNSTWLNKVFASWKNENAQWANKENYQKFEQLRTFYLQLPEAGKFKIIGVDVPQDYSLLKEQMDTILKRKTFDKWQPQIDSLRNILDTATYENRKVVAQFSKQLLPEIIANQAFFTKKLTTNYLEFKHLITSFTHLSPTIKRDSVMFRNLQSQIAIFKLESKKMYGFMGFYHCLQANYEGSKPLACQLKEQGLFGGKIVSVQMLAIDSKTMLPYSGSIKQIMPKQYAQKLIDEETGFPKDGRYLPYGLSNDGQMMLIDGIGVLKEASLTNSVTLFRLTGTNSPYNTSNKLAEVTGFQTLKLLDKKTVTTSAFQYVLLFRNSGAATPFDL